MNLFFDNTTVDDVVTDINRALVTAQGAVDIRNQLIHSEVVFIDNEKDLRTYQMKDIVAWGEEVDLGYTISDDLPAPID